MNFREKAIQHLQFLPPFSPVLNRIMASLGREDVSIAELAKLVERDTVLAGSVLKMVNSARYGRRGTITAVPHGLAILGLDRLRKVLLSLSVNRLWSNVKAAKGWSTARFNAHSLATALLADLLAQQVPVEFPEGAFVAGLFHDFGKLMIASGLPAQYEEILRYQAESRLPLEECERAVIGVTHAELSEAALDTWHLPGSVPEAVRLHHQPGAGTGGRAHLSLLVHAASECVNQLGISVALLPAPDNPEFHTLISLGIEDPGPVMETFQTEFAHMREYS
jgi:HD-like signal output (HDOD) protein